MKRTILILIGCLGTMIMVHGQEQKAEQLLSAAIYQEEVNGELDAAIKTYQLIIKQYPENRKVAAEAYFHMGMCFEKMGKQEAAKAYQEILQKYGEQKELVAKARERLSKLNPPGRKSKETEGIKIRQIWKESYLGDLGTVSSDGRFRSGVDWEGWGDLAIYNLINGEMRTLTHEADSNHFVLNSAISKNGKQIAYCWWGPDHTYDLCLVDVDNPVPRTLYRQEGEEVYPVTWLSDNELIMTRYIRTNHAADMVLLNASDKTFKVLKSFERSNWPRISASPDGKYIAYDIQNESNNENFDIHLLPLDGGDEISLVNHPANDRVLGWVPGRREFLFISDRSGNWDLWAIPLKSGPPAEPAKRIYTNIGDVGPVGFAQNGDCYVGFSRRGFNAYLKAFNMGEGEVSEKEGETLLGSNFWVKWSPDGQSLAYIQEENNSENPWQLTIKDLGTGKERKLAENLFTSECPCWSPDGHSMLVLGIEKMKVRNNDFSRGIYLVDVQTGQTSRIFLLSDYKFNVPADDSSPLSDLEWSADGKSFYYLLFKDRLVKHDLESGEDRVLYEDTHFDRNILSRSPDGKNLLFAIHDPQEKKSHLLTMPASGGEAKEVCTSQESNRFTWGRWSTDGKYIFFTDRSNGTHLWRVPATGGTPEQTWQSKDRAEIFSFHPDGKEIAYAMRERTTEVRVIENLVTELERMDNTAE